jgi:hypothetical protein
MPTSYILACKQLNGLIYINRLGQAINDTTPGIPDIWYSVGPGLRPSIQLYFGTQYILTFEYLSHLFCRVIDTAVWPPTSVNPVAVSGGPNPPTAYTYQIELAADSLALQTKSTTAFGLVQSFYNPVQLQQPLLFLNPITDTYSVTIQTLPGWAPQISPGLTAYYQIYRRTFTPTIGPWMLIQNWTVGPVDFTDTNVGSLQFQYTVIWGTQFNFTDQWNPNNHEGGIVGETYITVNSATQHASYQATINEELTLNLASTEAYGIFGSRQLFLSLSSRDYGSPPSDEIQLSKSLIGTGDEAYGFFGGRQLFLYTQASDQLTYPFTGGIVPGPNNFSAESEAAPAYIGI